MESEGISQTPNPTSLHHPLPSSSRRRTTAKCKLIKSSKIATCVDPLKQRAQLERAQIHTHTQLPHTHTLTHTHTYAHSGPHKGQRLCQFYSFSLVVLISNRQKKKSKLSERGHSKEKKGKEKKSKKENDVESTSLK